MDDKLLPPLPEPADTAYIQGPQGGEYRTLSTSYEPGCAMFSPEQMQAYARAALAHAQPVNAQVREALSELLFSHTAPYPSAEDGQAAQTAWVHRQSNAVKSAQWVLATTQSDSAGDAPDWKRFALAVLIDSRENLGSDVDGGMVQDVATECGLLVKVEATGACDEHACTCVEYGFPVDCYRYTPGTLAAIAASAAKGDQQ